MRRHSWFVTHAATALLTVALTGCGIESFNLVGPIGGSSPNEMVANVLEYGSFAGPHGDKKDDKNGALVCPEIVVRDGTDVVRVYASGESSGNVRYQYGLGDVARQCAPVGRQITLKVGVEGTVLIGPAGAPGTFTVPVRVVVMRESDQEAAFTKLYTVPVVIPAGQTQAPFRFVAENIAVPFVSNKGNTDYTVQVGLDSAGGKPAASGRKRQRARRAPPAAAAEAPAQ